MSTRPALERLQAIDRAVNRWAWPNARTLARELEVTRRTIQRDIAFMAGFMPRWSLTASGGNPVSGEIPCQSIILARKDAKR